MPEIFYFVRAADPRPSSGRDVFNLDKIAPFIRSGNRTRSLARVPIASRYGIEVILTYRSTVHLRF